MCVLLCNFIHAYLILDYDPSLVFVSSFVCHFHMFAYPNSIFDHGFSEPDPVIVKKYGNENERGIFPPVSVCFHP